MKQFVLITLGLCVLATTSVLADTAATSQQSAKSIKPATLTCEEFLSYDEVTRPQIVYWSEGMSRKGDVYKRQAIDGACDRRRCSADESDN